MKGLLMCSLFVFFICVASYPSIQNNDAMEESKLILTFEHTTQWFTCTFLLYFATHFNLLSTVTYLNNTCNIYKSNTFITTTDHPVTETITQNTNTPEYPVTEGNAQHTVTNKDHAITEANTQNTGTKSRITLNTTQKTNTLVTTNFITSINETSTTNNSILLNTT